MAKTHKKATDNRQLFLSANGANRAKWEQNAQKAFDFYLDDQLTETEINDLREAGMPDFTINRITPVVEMMVYFCTDNNPKWQAIGLDGSDTDIAHVHSTIAEYCWGKAKGQSLYAQVIRDSLVKGAGYLQVDVDPNADRGMGDVTFNRLNPFDVYVDPKSTDFLFRDAAFIQIKKNISRTQLMNELPEYAGKLKKATAFEHSGATSLSDRDLAESVNIQDNDISSTHKVDGSEDDILDYYETYSKKMVEFVNVKLLQRPKSGELKEMQKEVDAQLAIMAEEMEVSMKEQIMQIDLAVENGEIIPERAELEKKKLDDKMAKELELSRQKMLGEAEKAKSKIVAKILSRPEFDTYMESAAFKSLVQDFSPYYEPRIEVCVSVGDKYLYTYMLNIPEYPIVPFNYMYTGTPFPVGAVSPLIGKQKEINKAHQLMLHNANLASNLRWMYEEGSIPEEEWENYSSSPGALLKVRQGFTPPTPISPAPLNSAFYQVTQQGKTDIEYMSGVYSSMQGDTSSQPETYRGLLASDEHGTRRLKSFIRNSIEPALEQVGTIFKAMAQDTYRANKVFRIVQPNASGGYEEQNVEINVPLVNEFGKAIEKWNDYNSAEFDVKVVSGSTLPVNRWALVEEYFRWYQAGLIDDVAMLNETDIRGKEKVIERKSQLSQLQSAVSNYEEQVKDLNDTVESLQRQLVTSGIRQRVQAGSLQAEKELLNTKAEQKLMRGRIKDEGNLKRKELMSKVDSALKGGE